MLGHTPLSPKELEELEEFLMSDACPERAMDLEMMDGLLTAVVSGPDVILPSEWYPVLWGGKKGPVFESMEQVQKITGLILRHMNWLAKTLMDYPDEHDFLFHEWDDSEFYLRGYSWVNGYLKGMELRQKQWKELTSDDNYAEMIMPIFTLMAKPDDPEFGKLVDTPEKRQVFLDMLSDTVLDIYDYWLERRARNRKHEPAKSVKVGRNEPCPCGSGKKHKKCCGAPENLH